MLSMGLTNGAPLPALGAVTLTGTTPKPISNTVSTTSSFFSPFSAGFTHSLPLKRGRFQLIFRMKSGAASIVTRPVAFRMEMAGLLLGPGSVESAIDKCAATFDELSPDFRFGIGSSLDLH